MRSFSLIIGGFCFGIVAVLGILHEMGIEVMPENIWTAVMLWAMISGGVLLAAAVTIFRESPPKNEPLPLNHQAWNGVNPDNAAESSEESAEAAEKTEDDDHWSTEEIIACAKKIADGVSWQVVRMHVGFQEDEWRALIFIRNAAGETETLDVSDWHDDSDAFFLLNEADYVTFLFTEESQCGCNGYEDPADFLRITALESDLQTEETFS